jgi:hypothetical protein
MNFLQKWWTLHGTKILGYGSAAIATVEYIDQKTVQLVETTFGPKYGPMLSHGILLISGLLTAKRGFVNSTHIQAQVDNTRP